MKMRECFTDPHYWKNPALRRSREKVHAVVARSTFRSQNVQSTPGSDHLEVEMATFGGSDVVSRGRRGGLCTLSKVSKT